MSDWVSVDDHLPTKDGRYQVVIIDGGFYHVTMRKFNAKVKRWFSKIPGPRWERCTCGITHWKPMSDLPDELKCRRDIRVLGFYEPVIRGK